MGYLSEVVWKDEYKYYNTPEGKDCGKKILYVTKYAGIYGLWASTVDIIALSRPKGYGNILSRYVFVTVPFMGIGAAAAAGVCAATNIRKKDDPLNYSIGSLAGTTVLAAWKKSFKIGVYGGVVMAVLAAIYKDMLDNHWPMISGKYRRVNITPWNMHQDWTLMKDPGRTWKTSNE